MTGEIDITVRFGDPSRLSRVEFRYDYDRCGGDGDPELLGSDATPAANGAYTWRLDTNDVDEGCVHLIATAVGKDGTRYPSSAGTWRRINVVN